MLRTNVELNGMKFKKILLIYNAISDYNIPSDSHFKIPFPQTTITKLN